MIKFHDKVVLVTGAGLGIGRAVAIAFASRGAIVAANDITPINLDKTIQHITSAGGRARDYVFDVAKRMPVAAMVNQVMNDLGRIDILINSATVNPRVPILEMDGWDWRRTLDVNLTGVFFTLQSVGRVMRELGGGSIVNTVSATENGQMWEDRAATIASKTGLIGFTRAAALEFAPYGIRVNAICTGLSPRDVSLPERPGNSQGLGQLTEFTGSMMDKAEEVTDLVLFLCSDAASHITGQSIYVEGSNVSRG